MLVWMCGISGLSGLGRLSTGASVAVLNDLKCAQVERATNRTCAAPSWQRV
jgi:hypothetical protein